MSRSVDEDAVQREARANAETKVSSDRDAMSECLRVLTRACACGYDTACLPLWQGIIFIDEIDKVGFDRGWGMTVVLAYSLALGTNIPHSH